MSLTIQTNIASLNAQKNLSKTQNALNKSIERLSSGLRINSAKDDAAGMAISNRFTSQTRGFGLAARNANDAISLLQTSEGAMQEVISILQRMRELAVQASNDTYSALDRASLQGEMDQLYAEVDRIAGSTQFNGINLTDGLKDPLSFQIGSDSGQTISVKLKSIKPGNLNLNGYSKLGELNSGRIGALGGPAAAGLSINGIAIGAAATTSTAKDGAAAINLQTGKTGVTAVANNKYKGAGNASGIVNGLMVNGHNVGACGNMTELVNNINLGVAGVTATLNMDGSLSLSNETGEDIIIGGSTTNSGLMAGTFKGYISLTDDANEAISIAPTPGGTVNNLNLWGFNTSTGSTSVTGGPVGTDKLAVGDLSINGVSVGASATASASDKAAAINMVRAETGVTASAKTEIKYMVNLTGADGTIIIGQAVSSNALGINDLTINGFSIGASEASASYTGATESSAYAKAAAINLKTGLTDVTATASTETIGYTVNQAYIIQGKLTSVTGQAVSSNALGINDLTINGFSIGPSEASAIFTGATESSAYAKATAINLKTGLTDVTATASTETIGYTVNTTTVNTGAGVTALRINGTAITIATGMTIAQVETAIDNVATTTGVVASIVDEKLVLRSAGLDINIGGENADDILGATATNITRGTISLVSDVGENIKIAGNNVASAGFTAHDGDPVLSINGTTVVGLVNTTDMQGVLDAINLKTVTTGVTAEDVNGKLVLTSDSGLDIAIGGADAAAILGTTATNVTRGTITLVSDVEIEIDGDNEAYAGFTEYEKFRINGSFVDLSEATSMDMVVSKINLEVKGVVASADKGGQLVLTSDTGMDIAITGTSKSSILGAAATYVTHGTILLVSDTGADVKIAGNNEASAGFTEQGGSSEAVGSGLSVMTLGNANNAIDRIDDAIDQVSENRSELGAVLNRLDSTIFNLQNSSENFSAANGRLLDADYAKETAEMAKSQILMQAGVGMMAQAKQLPNMVLQLLQQ